MQDGVVLDTEHGRVLVGEKFETNIHEIYAIGDIVAGPQLAHTAAAEGINLANIFTGKERLINTKLVPRCIYTYPNISIIGLTET
ncbi:MAG: FAD-dependent oxidoreductase [Eggerthellaceae bacterium]|nr:FAD-dependent oxidoreductase [Eggerthellaceae bacterium]